MDQDISEINLDTLKNISFERSEEPIVFSRDEELEKPDENILTTVQLQVAEQIKQQYGNKRPHPQFSKLVATTTDHKTQPIVTKNHNRTLLTFHKRPCEGGKWRPGKHSHASY